MKGIVYDQDPFERRGDIDSERALTQALARWLQGLGSRNVERSTEEKARVEGFGREVAGLRHKLGISRLALAQQTGIDPVYLCLIENGVLGSKGIPLRVASVLARELGQPLNQWAMLPWPTHPDLIEPMTAADLRELLGRVIRDQEMQPLAAQTESGQNCPVYLRAEQKPEPGIEVSVQEAVLDRSGYLRITVRLVGDFQPFQGWNLALVVPAHQKLARQIEDVEVMFELDLPEMPEEVNGVRRERWNLPPAFICRTFQFVLEPHS